VFLLNNIHDRVYDDEYPGTRGVRFDISDVQLNNKKNKDWYKIRAGSIACVVTGKRKLDTFYRVIECRRSDVADGENGFQYIMIGDVVGKLKPAEDMTSVLTKHNVHHPYLPGNQFSVGFNVADLEDKLASLEIDTSDGKRTIGQLEPT
jgi:hypothetical protein